MPMFCSGSDPRTLDHTVSGAPSVCHSHVCIVTLLVFLQHCLEVHEGILEGL